MPKVIAGQWVNSLLPLADSGVCSFAELVPRCWVIEHQLIRMHGARGKFKGCQLSLYDFIAGETEAQGEEGPSRASWVVSRQISPRSGPCSSPRLGPTVSTSLLICLNRDEVKTRSPGPFGWKGREEPAWADAPGSAPR